MSQADNGAHPDNPIQRALDNATITDAQLVRRDENGNIIETASAGDVDALLAELSPDELVELAQHAAQSEQSNPELDALAAGPGTTAAEKIMQTLRDLADVDEDAGELELMMASLAIALERGLGAELAPRQDAGELDEFMAALVRWIATLTSDDRPKLVVVPVPRRPLKPGQKLMLLLRAEQEYDAVKSPL